MHIYRTPRVRGAADAQLPVAVAAPALDPAPGRDDAGGFPTQGDGGGGSAWRVGGCVCLSMCVCVGGLCACVSD